MKAPPQARASEFLPPTLGFGDVSRFGHAARAWSEKHPEPNPFRKRNQKRKGNR